MDDRLLAEDTVYFNCGSHTVSLRMGRASAIAVIFFAIVLVVTLLQRRLMVREVEY